MCLGSKDSLSSAWMICFLTGARTLQPLSTEVCTGPQQCIDPLVMDSIRPFCSIKIGNGDLKEQVPQRIWVQDRRVEEGGKIRQCSVPHPQFLRFGGEVVQHFTTLRDDNRDKRTISEHISNIFRECELEEGSVVRKSRTLPMTEKTTTSSGAEGAGFDADLQVDFLKVWGYLPPSKCATSDLWAMRRG